MPSAIFANRSSSSSASSIKRCHLGDEVCYKTQAQNYLEFYKYGIPEHNVPSIEPLKIGTLRTQIGGEDSSIQLNLLMTNTSAHHFGSSMVVKSLTIMASPEDLSKPARTIMIMSSPLLNVTANYYVKGKFLILPINSKGKLSIILRQVDVKTVIDMLPEKREDGLHYLKITDYKMTVKTGRLVQRVLRSFYRSIYIVTYNIKSISRILPWSTITF